MSQAPGRTEAIAAAFAGLAFAAGAVLLREATVVPGGLFLGGAIVLAVSGSSLLAHRAWGRMPATLLRGAGIAAGLLVAASALVPPFDRAALPLAAWALAAATLQASTQAAGARVALAAAGVALLALGGAVAWIAAEAWPEAARLRTALALGTALVLAALLARLALARRKASLTFSPVGALLVAALAASYVVYRPLVAASVENLPLYEWTLGVGAAVLMLGRLRRGARDAAVNEAWSGEGRRHEQDAAPAYDPRMTPLAVPIQRYLETGDGFEEYRSAMLRAAPFAPAPFRKTLQGARPVQGRGPRAGKAARRERLVTHNAMMELLR